jgi:hypothetical protein
MTTKLSPPNYRLIRPDKSKPCEVLQNIGDQARDLVRELSSINSTNPPHKEQLKDQVFLRLSNLARKIERERSKGNTNDKIEEIYLLISNNPKNINKKVGALSSYGDVHKWFVKPEPTIGTNMFLKQLATSFNGKNGINTTLDPKELVYQSLYNCNRQNWLNKASDITCKSCWNEIMNSFFIITAQTFTVELNSLENKIEELYKNRKLTTENTEYLVTYMAKNIKKFSTIVRRATNNKDKSKEEWTELLESLFMVIVRIMNEMTNRYSVVN